MKLTQNRIGITDLMSFRECPRRFDFGLERFTEAGEHPESHSYATAYGSAFHDAAELLADEDRTDEEAVFLAFEKWFDWLEPDDIDRLRTDIKTYREREPTGVRLVGAEISFELPMVKIDGEVYSFRGKIDRLYQSLADPSVYYHVDYKTSAQPKSQAEVDADLQMWAYNYAIHELYPDCESLTQQYDQLQFGVIETRKSDEERRKIREWLQLQINAVVKYDKTGPDGRLLPKKNKWCGSCSVKMDCPIIGRFTEFGKAEIAALAPPGSELDRSKIIDYAEAMEDVALAKKTLEDFESRVKEVLLEMPSSEREALGFKTRSRKNLVFNERAKQEAMRILGSSFWSAVTLSQTKLNKSGATKEAIKDVLDLGVKVPGATFVVRK